MGRCVNVSIGVVKIGHFYVKRTWLFKEF